MSLTTILCFAIPLFIPIVIFTIRLLNDNGNPKRNDQLIIIAAFVPIIGTIEIIIYLLFFM